jgi:pyruvate/2-oxoglutarate dehydrogenase complex dihydrolipoamide dehydrogenase (E3) component
MNPSPSSFDFDVLVLGGGSAGYAAARTAATNGARVAVVEGAPELGGLCILRGCMPTKALLWAAEVRHLARLGPTWGLHPQPMPFDWSQVMSRKDQLIREFAEYRASQLADNRFQLLRTHAHFIDPHTVQLGDGRTLTAAQFVIATGSRVAPPPLPALNQLDALTSDDLIHLPTLPSSILILGGGVIAVELAQLLARFDVRVTLIQRSAQLLTGWDAQAAQVLADAFRQEGMTLHLDTHLLDAGCDGNQRWVSFRCQITGDIVRVEADAALLALGRLPNTESLQLAAAGVETRPKGRILTDPHQRTNVPHILAAGDCTSPHELVHLAVIQGEVAGHNACHPTSLRRADEGPLARVVFTDPALAVAGLGEPELQRDNRPFLCASYPFADHGKSLIMEARHGFVKLHADPSTGRLLGGTCVGPLAGELIHEILVALQAGFTAQQFAAIPHYHPTLSEIWTYPAEDLASRMPRPDEATPGGD